MWTVRIHCSLSLDSAQGLVYAQQSRKTRMNKQYGISKCNVMQFKPSISLIQLSCFCSLLHKTNPWLFQSIIQMNPSKIHYKDSPYLLFTELSENKIIHP